MGLRILHKHRSLRLEKQQRLEDEARRSEYAQARIRAEVQRRKEAERERQRQVRREQEVREQEESARATQKAKEHSQRQQDAFKAQQKQEDRRMYQQWREMCDIIFTHPAQATRIPEPPNWPCGDIGCTVPRKLKACRHNLERFFSATGDIQLTLNEERLRWSPNRRVFAELENNGVKGAGGMATELFQVMGSLRSE
ncbi:hypothetical protein LTR36_008287 [Oleoguttula mirabilis]|uniref:Uncharacterized protein n=1 Tax=Oleoguttula mirabilis TaxID=1507867 RepID=A0AAV9J8I3_9PEZI|nr:hypothetical protein LTR36_008287 [Oleoguttula mirabilis]